MKYIICDIDNTLSYSKYLSKIKRAWIKENEAPQLNTLPYIKGTYEIIQNFINSNYKIIFLTVRKENKRKMTEEWLEKIWFNKNDFELIMNNLDLKVINWENYDLSWNRIKSYKIKSIIYDKLVKGKNISFVLEDDESCVQMWRYEKGLLCFQINNEIHIDNIHFI